MFDLLVRTNLSRNRVREKLGDMLVHRNLLTLRQLETALTAQQRSGGRLGDILLSLQYIELDPLYRIIAEQHGIDRFHSKLDSFPNHARKLTEYAARRLNVVVMGEEEAYFTVAVAEPLRAKHLDHLELLLDKPVKQVLATPHELEALWKEAYAEELIQESTQKLILEQPENSAHITVTKQQWIGGIALAALLLSGLVWNWLWTLIIVNIMVQLFYFSITVFKFASILIGARKDAQIRFKPGDVDAIDERKLPVYTILVPMYKESEVIPHLLRNIEQLDYPKSKLDVRLLIEEDDIEAQKLLANMQLPSYFIVIVVPQGLPKTKPKACNYGLIHAKGEFVVIYDAEDRPERDQLKKAYAAFSRSPENCVCIQAKLNYFNNNQNLLTRLFTHEYSNWFELLLPGIMQMNIPIPLGGTSNHFKMSALRQLGAWDPYNVTEDADLGIRLYKAGFTTAIVDSITWEEANSKGGNWIRQRSRWIKGYMQTWLVHMRHPVRLLKELGLKGFIGFQMIVLGTPTTFLFKPLFWAMAVLWFGWKLDFISMFFPGPIYYMAMSMMLLGGFLIVFSQVAATYWIIDNFHSMQQYRFSYGLVKFALLTPLYWVLTSLAAVKAGWQLITKPFYWEKTIHGLAKDDTVHVPEPVVKLNEMERGISS